MSRIVHIATLWSLMGHPSRPREWSMERKIAAIADAGFDGFISGLTPNHRALADKYGLEHLVGFISSSAPEEFSHLVQRQKDGGARLINVQLDDDDTPPAVAVRDWIALENAAEKIGGVAVSLE